MLEIYHDIYDKVMLILSRRTPSATLSSMSTHNEVAYISDYPSSLIDNTYKNDHINLETKFKRSKSPSQKLNVINKDVEDALSLLQAGSIMMRVKSGTK